MKPPAVRLLNGIHSFLKHIFKDFTISIPTKYNKGSDEALPAVQRSNPRRLKLKMFSIIANNTMVKLKARGLNVARHFIPSESM